MANERPNILLIMSDNHTAGLLGCYGNDEIHTPNLDHLARQGFQFENAYSVNAMCSPCRAAILTGLMPSQHGIHTWLDDRLMDRWPPDWNAIGEFIALPQILQDNGYKTALIGKYHLGIPYQPQNGFDHWVTFPLGHTRSFYDNTVIDNGRQEQYAGHIVDYFTDKAVDYLGSQESGSDRPFFLFLSYNAPYGHWPSVQGSAQNRFAKLYENTEMRTVPREGLSERAIDRFLLRRTASGEGIDYSAHLRMPNDLVTLRNYFSQMSMVDDGVGRVMGELQRRGLEENTLVIYTCDHGFSLGHHGFWGHGQATWPANAHRPAYHIPLLVRHVGQIVPLQISTRMVSQIDLFATILDYAGLSHVQVNENAPSASLAPTLRGQPMARWTQRSVAEDGVFIEQEEMRAFRSKRWLYVMQFKGSRTYPLEDELYDLELDPAEKFNVVAQPEYADVASSLRALIDGFFSRHANPKYDLWRGGTTKSNTDKPWLWKDAWGEEWAPTYD